MHHMRSFVEGRWGHEGFERVLGTLERGEAAEIRALVPMTWHSLGLQHRLLRAIDDTLGEGDGELVREIGVYEANQDLRIIHRIFLRMANPAYVLEKAGQYWRRFYDTGRWEVTRHSAQHAVGVLRDCAPFDPLFAIYLHSYIHRLFELVGARDLQTDHSLDEGRTPPVLTVEGRWR